VGGNIVRVLIDRNVITGNGTGIISANPNSSLLVNDTTITQNSTGVSATGGAFLASYLTNRLNDNLVSNGIFTRPINLQ
jgi:hypothetical protein